MTLRRLLALLLLLGCAGRDLEAPTYEPQPAASEEPVRAEPTAPEPLRVTSEPFVWRIEKDGQVSHLMGTVHVGVTLDQALPPHLQERAANARVLMLEIDPTNVDPQVMLGAAQLPAGEKQESFFTPAVWHQVGNRLNGMIGEATLQRLRPWFTMIVLIQALVRQMHEGALPEAMDATLFRMGQDAEVPFRPLETLQAQIAAFASVDDTVVARMITGMVEDGSEREELERLLGAYRSGDVDRVERFILESEAEDEAPEFHEALIDRRNAAWMAPLREELDRGDAFVAVGLGHLVGEDGLLAMLRAAGYRVTRAR